MKLIRTEKSNKFCGPAALALITGRPVDEMVLAVKQLRRESEGFRGLRPVKGMYNDEMLRVLAGYGLKVTPMAREGSLMYGTNLTLAAWLRAKRAYRQEHPDVPVLINVTGHYVVLHGRKIYDNHNPDGVWLRRYRHRRKRVKYAWTCVAQA